MNEKENDKLKENKIISQHIFMFPFRILNKDKKEEPDIKAIFEAFKEGGWKDEPFNPFESPGNYSQYVYFHEYVRKAIFKRSKVSKDDEISYYLERRVKNNDKMTIQLKTKDEDGDDDSIVFELDIESISLHLFETQLGILTINLINYDYPDFNDILLINDFGRRIYPQFLPDNGDIKVVKDSFLADKIELKAGDIYSLEDFSYNNFFDKDMDELQVADYIYQLLGEDFLDKFTFVPIIDDRMFTLCWYGNDFLSNQLKEFNFSKNKYAYETSDDWYKFIFIDGKDFTCQNRNMKQDLIKQCTYPRWVDYGTLWGITRYSIMCLTDTEGFAYNVVRNHVQRMYYQMAIIMLAQRASILKFSDDVSRISDDIEVFVKDRKEEDSKVSFEEIALKVKKLNSSFIRFVNRLWFTEVTPQEQGIEMYNMALKNMDMQTHLNELREEIKVLYEFVDMQYENEKTEADRNINKNLLLLNILAIIFLPVTIVAGFFGMNLYFTTRPHSIWFFIVPLVIIYIIIYFILEFLNKEKNEVKNGTNR